MVVFYLMSYMNENISLLFIYYIYFILVLKFLWFIKKKESVIFNFLGTSFLLPKSSYHHEN